MSYNTENNDLQMKVEQLISVIVPVYNVETFLMRCLESIISQTYHNIEIILVDDGSTDSSGEICDTFAKTESRAIVIHQENRGLWHARNTGQNKSRGEFLMFVDSDDYLHVDAIRVLYEALIQYPTCGLAMCRYQLTSTLKEDIRKVDENRIEIWSVEQLIYNHKGALCYVVWNKLYRRSLISDIRAREYRIAQDADFNLRVFLRLERLVMVHRELYFWVQRLGSATKTKDYEITRLMTVTDILHRNFVENQTNISPILAFYLRRLYILMASLKAHVLGTDYKKKAFLQCSEFTKDTWHSYLKCAMIPLLERCGIFVLLYNPRLMKWYFSMKR
jgi:glycosyltransferase involved in cell wall biosynthesis